MLNKVCVRVCVGDRYSAGDVVMMRPCNTSDDVEQFCQLLRLNPDSYFVLTPTDSNTGVCVCMCHEFITL